jgi:hypothetical protein
VPVPLVKLTVVSFEPIRQPRPQVCTEAISSQKIRGARSRSFTGIDLSFATFAEHAFFGYSMLPKQSFGLT